VSVVCCRRLSSSVTLPAVGPAAERVGGQAADTARRASRLRLRPVRATPCLFIILCISVTSRIAGYAAALQKG